MGISIKQHWLTYTAFIGGVGLALFICFFLDIQSFSIDTTGGFNVTTREQNEALVHNPSAATRQLSALWPR